MASPFSGKAGRNAAVWTANAANSQFQELQQLYAGLAEQAGGYLSNAFNKGNKYLSDAYKGSRTTLNRGGQQATDYLNAGMTGALAESNRGFDTGRGDINAARDAALAAFGQGRTDIQGGYTDALSSLQQLYGQGASTLQGAADEFNPLIDRAMSGYDMYMNSLGLNGAGGNQAALDAFRAGPAYQWQQQQATSGAQRAANAVGASAGGGNAMDAVTRLSSRLAQQEYGGWQDRLAGFQGAAHTATAGRAGVLAQLADLYQNQGNQTSQLQTQQGRDLAALQGEIAQAEQNAGSQLSALEQNRGTSNAGIVQQGNTALATNATNMAQLLANLQSQYGLNQTNLTTQYGGARANLATAITDALAAGNNQRWGTTIQAGQQGMMAGQQAAANRMGAIMGGLQLAGSAIGGIAGLPVSGGGSVGGNLLNSLFGK